MLLVGLGFGYKLLSLKIGFTNGVVIAAVAFAMLMAPFMIWLGAASIIGAVRRSTGVTVTSEGIASTSIFGTSWAEWSSLGSFTEGTLQVGPCGAHCGARARLFIRGAWVFRKSAPSAAVSVGR